MTMQNNNRKKQISIILILLLLIGFGVWWTFFRLKAAPSVVFTTQGTTKITDNDPEIRIWDYSAIDGDTINVYFDDKLIFDHLGITDSQVVYKPGKLAKGMHYIGIKSINDGMMGSASPHLTIRAGKDSIDFDIDSYKDSASGSWGVEVQ